MKILLCALLSIATCGVALGQVPDDGHLKFNFSGVIGGYFLIGAPGEAPEQSVDMATCCGKFYKLLDPKQSPDGHSGDHLVKFKTGPVISQKGPPFDYARDTIFGRGGQIDVVAGSAGFLPCSNDRLCEYHGQWQWSMISIRTFTDGSHLYHFEGDAHGTYCDAQQPIDSDGKKCSHHVFAHFQQESLRQWNTFAPDGMAQQSWGIGSLQVALSTQGAK
jgi:hypothetical protein